MQGFVHAEINIWKEKKKGMNVPPPELLCDVTDKIPLEDDSVDFIYSRATLEHFTYRELVNHLLECQRVLKVGGLIRACVPDFDAFVRDYQAGIMRSGTDWVEPNPDFPVDNATEYFIYQMMYHDHRYLHNSETLSGFLDSAGFSEIEIHGEGQTRMTAVSDQLVVAEEGRSLDHLMIEAVKSGDQPTIERFEREYPSFFLYKLLAKYLNIEIRPYVRSRTMFPSRSWLRERVRRMRQRT
jgi:predicted SAM-dependent methyltransferase